MPLALAAVYSIWGSTYLAMRVAVETLPPWGQAGTRFTLAGLVLLAVARVRGEPWPAKRAWLVALPIGALLFGMGNGLVAAAERTVSSGLAAVVCSTTPLIAAGVSAARGERPTRNELLGMLLGVFGVAQLGLGASFESAGLGGVMIVLAPIGFALGSLWSRAEARRTPGLAGVALPMIMGGLVLLGVSLLSGESLPTEVTARSALAWGYLVVFGSLVGFTAYGFLLRNARPAVAMSYAYVNPIVAVGLGALVLHEALTWSTALAAVSIIAGVTVAITRPAAPAPPRD